MNTFTLKIEKFEGPIDLLLQLIEKRKMHISDVSLASVADDYVSYIENNEGMPVEETANFIVVASTLLLIKSLSLLPTLEVTEEEKTSIEELEMRLKLFKAVREKSKKIEAIFGENILFARTGDSERPVIFSPSKDTDKNTLLAGLKEILKNVPEIKKIPKVLVQKVVSLEEMINNLSERIQKNLKMTFKDFAGIDKAEKVNIVVSFLAMLELVKQGSLVVTQHANFGDIHMETEGDVSVPQYN